MVIMENDTRKNTKGQIFPVKRLQVDEARSVVRKTGKYAGYDQDLERVPLQLYEARNAS